MNEYRQFLRRLVRNYIVGSVLAVLCVGGAVISSALQLTIGRFDRIFVVLLVSFLFMVSLELLTFSRQVKPIRALFLAERPSPDQIRDAYVQIHRLPALSVLRIMGPHLLGLSIPAVALSLLFIHRGWIDLPVSYIGIACSGAILVAGMHALVEYFLTDQAIRPLLQHVSEMGSREYGIRVSLDGRVIVSTQRKFQLSAFSIGTFPLFFFVLATQIRLTVTHSPLIEDYWKWASLILVFGVFFSSLGAWLLSRSVRQPIGNLEKALRAVQTGDLDVRASDLYSDEFSRLVSGFNHMVQGLSQRERVNEQLLQSYFSTLAAALDARDTYTAGHSQRVSEYSLLIGREAGLSDKELDLLNKTALLHDIGKIGVRDSVLLKDGRLTDEEFEQIKKHSILGEEILKRVEPAEMMAPLLPGVRSHHERYDGRGYPDGLAGKDIPVFGRIIAVADAFDAMTSDRPYRSGMPLEKAISIISDGKGTQWDPYYAQLFINAFYQEKEEAAPLAYTYKAEA
ncbi:HD domain-containing protein [Saccharibacillus sp. CPCC 101409]|uniref:HD domain-containing phosphohydrolase n=1 Tax=Saccharibacillus sp. CPCC 101409 TaxID=3058041 RepID=UPI002670F28D|nr:HD domain-containing phosphohydrolase [Saccharibacillus sp. CPCC 101409]MDO3411659.1 HD domain-containing protein [Saccharibacillus sp. CPCC 101409]